MHRWGHSAATTRNYDTHAVETWHNRGQELLKRPTQAGRASAVVGGRVRGLQGSCGLWSCHRSPLRCSEVREQSDRTGIAEDAKQEEMPTTKVVLKL